MNALATRVAILGLGIFASYLGSRTPASGETYEIATAAGRRGSDTEPPSIPGQLTVTATTASRISIAWRRSTANTRPLSYEIERSPDGVTWQQVGRRAGTKFFDSNLPAGTFYSYRVRARDGAGNASAFSAILESATNYPRDVAGDDFADGVLGQIDFQQSMSNEVTGFKGMNGGGVVVDRSVRPNRVYFYDAGNSRVLGHDHLGRCVSHHATKCTTHSDCPGSRCDYTYYPRRFLSTDGRAHGKPAEIALGQPSAGRYSACNADGNMELRPRRRPPTAATLCSMPPVQLSPWEGGSAAQMDVDGQGHLYVPDFHNNRVLKFESPFTTDTVADDVWGQSSFSGFRCNGTGPDIGFVVPSPTASSLCFGVNDSYQIGFVAGVDLAADGLWVADTANHRVVRYPRQPDGAIAKVADVVLGAPVFTARGGHTTGPGGARVGPQRDRMCRPSAVRVYERTDNPEVPAGTVFVADTGDCAQRAHADGRILVFKPPFQNGMAAHWAIGEWADPVPIEEEDRSPATDSLVRLRGPGGIEFDRSNEGVWVHDTGNQQLLLFSFDGTQILKVLFKDTPQFNGLAGPRPRDSWNCIGSMPNPSRIGEVICDAVAYGAAGGLGIDDDRNLYAGISSAYQDVRRFPRPADFTPGTLHSADLSLLSPPPGGINYLSNKGCWHRWPWP